MVTEFSIDPFKKRLKRTKDILAGRVYSPEEAKTEFGLEIEAGWSVKPVKFEPAEGGIAFSYKTPEGWEIKPGGAYVSPQGRTYSKLELEALEVEEGKRQERVAAFEDYKTPEGKYDIGAARAAGIAEEDITALFGEVPEELEIPTQELSETLETQLRDLYPDMFKPTKAGVDMQRVAGIGSEITSLRKEWVKTGDPGLKAQIDTLTKELEEMGVGTSLGITEEDLPAAALSSLIKEMEERPEAFLEDLYGRTTQEEAESFLRTLGIEEDVIAGISTELGRVEDLEGTVRSVLNMALEAVPEMLEERPSRFLDRIRLGGKTDEKERMLRGLGIEQDAIDEIFSVLRFSIQIDGAAQTVDITPEGKAFNEQGQWVGTYNRATKLFDAAKNDEGWFKDNIVDPWVVSSVRLGQDLAQFGAGVMAELLYAEMPEPNIKMGWNEDLVKFMNETNRQMRDTFRFIYGERKREYEEWEVKHPELIPKPEYVEGIQKHPGLLFNPGYYAYEFASTAPISLAVMSIVAAGAITGNIPAGIIGGMAVMTPAESASAYQAMIDAGAPEEEAAEWGLFIGSTAGLIETFSDLFFLKVIAAPVAGLFRKGAVDAMAKATVAHLAKKGISRYSATVATEIAEEALTLAISNSVLKIYDENKGVWDDMLDTALRTFAAVTPIAGLTGVGTSVAVSRQQASGIPDSEKRVLGWIQDSETGQWVRPMLPQEIKNIVNQALRERGEAGFIELPVGPEGKVPTPKEIAPVVAPEVMKEFTKSGKPLTYYDGRKIKDALKFRSKEERENLAKALFTPRVHEGYTLRLEDIKEVRGLPKTTVDELLKTEGIDVSDIWTHAVNPHTGTELGFDVYEQWITGVPTPEVTPAAPVTEAPTPQVPVTEPGMPEAGIQPALIEGVPAVEVRPAPAGRVVQISMEEQLKLDEARKAVEAAPDDVRQSYEAQAEIEGLQVTLVNDPVATTKFKLGGKNVDLTAFISIREQTFPEYFTLKQAQAIKPDINTVPYSQPGTPLYNRVPRVDALDEFADKWGMTTDDIASRVEQIRKDRQAIKDLEANIKDQMTSTPLPLRKEPTSQEVAKVTESWENLGQPKMTLKEATDLAGFFGEYVLSENAVSAYELQRELFKTTRAERFRNFKSRMQELIISQGMPVEEAYAQASQETLSGALPIVSVDYFDNLTKDVRDALFSVVYHNEQLQQYPSEMAATLTALTNAIGTVAKQAKAIPRKKGTGSVLFPQGGSAWDRLAFVFGPQTKTFKAIEKMAKEGKSVRQIIDGVAEITAMAPIDIGATFEQLPTIPRGQARMFFGDLPRFLPPLPPDTRTPSEKTIDLENFKLELTPGVYEELSPERRESLSFLRINLLKGEYQTKLIEEAWIPPTPRPEDKRTPAERALDLEAFATELAPPPPTPPTLYEVPIAGAFKQLPLMTFAEQQTIVRILKGMGMTAIDIGNFVRANKASFDMSFWRQQKTIIAGHPVAFYRANVEAFKALFSQREAEANEEWITRDPLYQFYEEIGIDFLRPLALPKGTAQWRGVEEFGYITGERTLPRLAGKIPWIKWSSRAFVTGTNTHNWLVFKTLYQATLRRSEKIASGEIVLKEGEAFDIKQEMRDYAAMLADFTQRAQLGEYSVAAPALGALFFAPRSKLGRLFTPRHLWSPNPRVRKEAWKDLGLFVTANGGIIMAGAMLGLWDVETDPKNAEYMSIRIGNLRIDPWAGHRQFVVFYARLLSKTGVSSVTGAEYEADPIKTVTNFFRGALSPLSAAIVDFTTGRNFLGEEVDVKDVRQWLDRILPFSVQDIWEAFDEHWKLGAISVVPAIFGEGVGTYTGDWVENWGKLGIRKYPDLPEPLYDIKDWYSDTSNQFTGVELEQVTPSKAYPEYIRVLVEVKEVKKHLTTLANERLVNINADPTKGLTFKDYHDQWLERQKLVNAGEDAEFTAPELQEDRTYKEVTFKGEDAVAAFDRDERFRDAQLGNFSQRQYALLIEYWSMEEKDRSVFLEKNKGLIGINPYQEYLRTHTDENAKLAVMGQVDVKTRDAYNKARQLVDQLDMPDGAIEEYLPPEHIADIHFSYHETGMVEGYSSNEVKLLILEGFIKAEEEGVESYIKWREEGDEPLTLPDKPLDYYKFQVDNSGLYDRIDEIRADDEIDDVKKDKDDGLTDKERAVADVRATKVGDETFHDIERRVEAIGKGMREQPLLDETVNDFVEHRQITDERGGSSAWANLNRYGNSDLNEFLMSEDYWGKDALDPLHKDAFYLDKYLVPRWWFDVKYETEETEYQDILDRNDGNEHSEEAVTYIAGHEDYRKEKRKHQALGLTSREGDRFPLEEVESYIGYYELPVAGQEQERFLVMNGGENPDNLTGFALAMSVFGNNGKGMDIPRPEDVPDAQYDLIYKQYRDQFEKLAGFSDRDSDHYISDPEPGLTLDQTRAKRARAERYGPDGKMTDFGKAEKRRDAYGLKLPNEQVEDYVEFSRIEGEGKPKDYPSTLSYWEDDWFLMEHPELWSALKRTHRETDPDWGKEREKNWAKVPSRTIGAKYIKYKNLDTQEKKDQYRLDNPDLDKWGVAVGIWSATMSERRKALGETPTEKFKKHLGKSQEEFEERLEEAERKLKGG